MSETMRPALQSMGMDEWTAWVQQEGEPAYRATQIFSWVHEKQVTDYAEMTNISMGLKVALSRDFESEPLSLVKRQTSSDGTNKFLFELADGAHIESVFMPYHHGNSVCISTQVGCSMDCVFCASTLDGKLRNLSRGEMLAQVYEIQRIMGERVSHVVMMGMGEPLDNIIECTAFIRMINDPRGQGMSMRHITLSTCGITPGIRRLAGEELPITLAISLHAPTQAKRERIMPIARRFPLDELMAACDDYFKQTGRRVTYEYALIAGVNDTEEDAGELAHLLAGRGAHLNLIPVNPTGRKIKDIGEEREITRPTQLYIEKFQENLEKNGINVTIRREMGADIDGACGQLRQRVAGAEYSYG